MFLITRVKKLLRKQVISLNEQTSKSQRGDSISRGVSILTHCTRMILVPVTSTSVLDTRFGP